MDGMYTWHFGLVMEFSRLMLQGALLLFGCALSDYLFSIDKAVASIVIGFTAFGILFYLLTVFAATFYWDCPFQTPLSLILRLVFRPRDHGRKKKRGPNDNSLDHHIKLPMTYTPDQPPSLFDQETDLEEYVLDSECIARMFQTSIDADVSMAIMRFIPEIVWHAGIQTTPVEKLYDTVVDCFDHSSGYPVVIPKLRDNAYLGARALVHLAIQRKCIGNDSDQDGYRTIGFKHDGEDPDLESTLGIIDRVCGFSISEPMRWEKFSFTVPHHAWMSHILLYRAWDSIMAGQPLPDDTREFVLHSLRSDPPPPTPIVADCLFIVGLVIGIELHIDDLLVVDKR